MSPTYDGAPMALLNGKNGTRRRGDIGIAGHTDAHIVISLIPTRAADWSDSDGAVLLERPPTTPPTAAGPVERPVASSAFGALTTSAPNTWSSTASDQYRFTVPFRTTTPPAITRGSRRCHRETMPRRQDVYRRGCVSGTWRGTGADTLRARPTGCTYSRRPPESAERQGHNLSRPGRLRCRRTAPAAPTA